MELQFKPTTLPDQPAPDLSNTVLRWQDDDKIWVVVEGFATDLLSQQPDGEHDLEVDVAIGAEEEDVDWSIDVGDDVKKMELFSPAQAPTDRSPVVGDADLDMEPSASMEVEEEKENVLSLCSRLLQERAESMSPEVHTATFTVMVVLLVLAHMSH